MRTGSARPDGSLPAASGVSAAANAALAEGQRGAISKCQESPHAQPRKHLVAGFHLVSTFLTCRRSRTKLPSKMCPSQGCPCEHTAGDSWFHPALKGHTPGSTAPASTLLPPTSLPRRQLRISRNPSTHRQKMGLLNPLQNGDTEQRRPSSSGPHSRGWSCLRRTARVRFQGRCEIFSGSQVAVGLAAAGAKWNLSLHCSPSRPPRSGLGKPPRTARGAPAGLALPPEPLRHLAPTVDLTP